MLIFHYDSQLNDSELMMVRSKHNVALFVTGSIQ